MAEECRPVSFCYSPLDWEYLYEGVTKFGAIVEDEGVETSNDRGLDNVLDASKPPVATASGEQPRPTIDFVVGKEVDVNRQEDAIQCLLTRMLEGWTLELRACSCLNDLHCLYLDVFVSMVGSN